MIRSLHSAASGMEAQQTQIDVIANNLANSNTVGFKKARAEFQDLLYQEVRAATKSTDASGGAGQPTGIEIGQGTRLVTTQKMFHAGDLRQTGNQLDLAIEGQGFFRIQERDGQFAYTRAGQFKVTAEGQIVSSLGQPLSPPVFLPPDTTRVTIERDGTIKAHQPEIVEPVEVGRVELSQFVNPAGLKSLGNGLFRPTEGSGAAVNAVPGDDGLGDIAQGMLEGSNVKVVEEMIDLIAAQRAYEINSRVIQAADQMLGEVAQLR
ncbi:MAG: flagellar basal-body rod protein FlgG [Myxococcota bacterium]|jgi:flagellar basal-body rod protein FlgG